MIMTKTVGELCKQIKGIYNLNGSADTVITGISSDSRQIEAGYLFVCISGVHVAVSPFPPLPPPIEEQVNDRTLAV